MIHRNEDGTFAQGTNAWKRFQKGGTPWNKGLRGIHMNSDTEFKEDQYVEENHPSWKGGVQVHNKDGVYLWIGKNSRIRRARKVYEDTYREIPRGYVTYHKDRNNLNDHPSNLVAISRAELVRKNTSKKSNKNN
ncbi:HNH endonuclease [Methanosarcina sp. UBA5]|uniref:HNH endonuclease n=1 Tax=Methanosarcina sp. UBA5 TaxID=1915593 RepID=UPI0025D8EBD3|nr:HNH endonuclease [Methanosarcina sp. UBA5]